MVSQVSQGAEALNFFIHKIRIQVRTRVVQTFRRWKKEERVSRD